MSELVSDDERLVRPWLAEAADLAAELDTHPDRGLTNAEAAERLERFGPNQLEPEAPIPAWRKLLAQFADPLVYLLLAAVAISLVTWAIEGAHGVPFEALVIAAILIANAVLGYVQEAKAEQAVAALQRMAAPMSTVLREGVQVRLPTVEVVPGDVLVLAEGDAVGADGRLLEAASLTVAEASLTGESEPVLKDTATLSGSVGIGDRVNMVFSGTAITRGRGRALVTGTGMSTEMGRIARLLGETEEERTPLQREIDHVGRTLGIAVLLIAAVVVAAILLTSHIDEVADVVDVLIIGVSLAVAAVPEGLPAILSVVLALGVQRMARENAIVKQLSSVETLGSATAVCSDKTGTLTRNEMTILRVVTRSGEVEVTGVGYRPVGGFVVDGGPLQAGPLRDEVRAVLSLGALASDASVREESGEWIVHGDPTEAAFVVAERKAGFIEGLVERFPRVGEVPFSSERKLMSTVHEDAERDGGVVVATKGAPDVLLARCAHERIGERTQPLDDERRGEILAAVDALADRAFRVLGTAYRPLEEVPDEAGEHLEHGLTFAGVVGIIDPPRSEARVAIDEARRAGIRVLMITGDHPRTALRIAEELDMVDGDTRTVTGAEIEELDAGAFREAVHETSVYARVAPEHKLRIVDALQADGHIVAMTGDGVNDAPALKRADIGVAMGITGTDVAKEAANMILADDNFATIVDAVREGRGIFSNIRKFLRYLLSSNAGEVLTMFFGVIGAGIIGLDPAGAAAAVPLLATQILWINLLTDAAPALAMGVDPPPDDVMSRSPRRLTARVIDGPMQVGIVFVGVVMAAATLMTLDIDLPGGLVEGSGTLTHARTMAFTTLVLAQLFNCFNARSERVSAFHNLFTNPLLWGAIGLSLLLQVAVVYLPFLNEPFGTTALGARDWVLCTVSASAVLWAN
ncbi:MAG TPA: cation-translocating P-type ATPase, partial [Actinomycetota bacterium]|nr:cation-translocating P-type ATPase [Actinomycetota bacterium]